MKSPDVHNVVKSARVETFGMHREKKKTIKYHFAGRNTWKLALKGVQLVEDRLEQNNQPNDFVSSRRFQGWKNPVGKVSLRVANL